MLKKKLAEHKSYGDVIERTYTWKCGCCSITATNRAYFYDGTDTFVYNCKVCQNQFDKVEQAYEGEMKRIRKLKDNARKEYMNARKEIRENRNKRRSTRKRKIRKIT